MTKMESKFPKLFKGLSSKYGVDTAIKIITLAESSVSDMVDAYTLDTSFLFHKSLQGHSFWWDEEYLDLLKEPKFKVGDEVTVIATSAYKPLAFGKCGEVIEVYEGSCWVEFDNGGSQVMQNVYIDHLVEGPEEPKFTVFIFNM